MVLLRWKDEYSVGIEAVDHEHKELIDLINRLHEQLSTRNESAEAFFGDLFKGISAHFALEERFMGEHGYDQFSQHKADHERLLDDLRDMMDELSNDEQVADSDLSTRLDAWFSRHFETHDARLHKALGPHPA
jgi:hemerythrin-like metal-binding protein